MNKYKMIKNASILGIIGNIFLLIIKGLIGFSTNSMSMIADAFNSAGDIVSSLMTYIGNKISSVPKDYDHNLGHGKAEYIYSMLISIIIFMMSYEVFKSSFITLINKENYIFSPYLTIVCIITILVKLFLFIYTNKLSKDYNNLLIKANAKDHRNDILITTLNLMAIFLSKNGIYYFDGIVGMVIAVWIFISGLKIFIESYNILMDISIDQKTKADIIALVKRHENVLNCINFYAIPIGYNYVVIFTIEVDGQMTTYDSHKLAEHLEKEISNHEKIEKVIIHVDPV